MFAAIVQLALLQAPELPYTRIDGRAPERITVVVAGQTPPDNVPDLEMVRQLLGVVAVIVRPAEIRTLLRSETPQLASIAQRDSIQPLWDLRLEREDEERLIRIGVDANGAHYFTEPHSTHHVAIDQRRFASLTHDWITPADRHRNDALPRAEVIALHVPPAASPLQFDRPTVSKRLSPKYAPAAIALAAERFFVRLPVGYTDDREHGLVVWIDPSPSGRPPPHLFQALDELGLVCIGAANSGNNRLLVERCQLAADAAYTAQQTFRIDADRVYAVGLSGGGKVSSILAISSPDVFKGAVPIVGMSMYRHIPVPKGRVRAIFKKPSRQLLSLAKESRIAGISGPHDGNYEPVKSAVSMLKRDGFDSRFFEYPDMGHTMPTPERFRDAMTWVDEPARKRSTEAALRAQTELDAYTQRHGSAPPPNEEARRMLEAIIRDAPWTDAAFEALERLEIYP